MQAGANLVLRQSHKIGKGQSEHIHTADPRNSVRLQMYPKGFEWAQQEPVLVSQGFSDLQVKAMFVTTSIAAY